MAGAVFLFAVVFGHSLLAMGSQNSPECIEDLVSRAYVRYHARFLEADGGEVSIVLNIQVNKEGILSLATAYMEYAAVKEYSQLDSQSPDRLIKHTFSDFKISKNRKEITLYASPDSSITDLTLELVAPLGFDNSDKNMPIAKIYYTKQDNAPSRSWFGSMLAWKKQTIDIQRRLPTAFVEMSYKSSLAEEIFAVLPLTKLIWIRPSINDSRVFSYTYYRGALLQRLRDGSIRVRIQALTYPSVLFLQDGLRRLGLNLDHPIFDPPPWEARRPVLTRPISQRPVEGL